MEEILNKLGFIYFTGPMWKHKKTNVIITISDENTPEDIVSKLIEIGEGECQRAIKTALGIKP